MDPRGHGVSESAWVQAPTLPVLTVAAYRRGRKMARGTVMLEPKLMGFKSVPFASVKLHGTERLEQVAFKWVRDLNESDVQPPQVLLGF